MVKTALESGSSYIDLLVDPEFVFPTHREARIHGGRLISAGQTNSGVRMMFEVPQYLDSNSLLSDVREIVGKSRVVFFRKVDDFDPNSTNPVVVDTSPLSKRQADTVATAIDMGYYDKPRKTSMTELGNALNIQQPTFSNYKKYAFRKLIPQLRPGLPEEVP